MTDFYRLEREYEQFCRSERRRARWRWILTVTGIASIVAAMACTLTGCSIIKGDGETKQHPQTDEYTGPAVKA